MIPCRPGEWYAIYSSCRHKTRRVTWKILHTAFLGGLYCLWMSLIHNFKLCGVQRWQNSNRCIHFHIKSRTIDCYPIHCEALWHTSRTAHSIMLTDVSLELTTKCHTQKVQPKYCIFTAETGIPHRLWTTAVQRLLLAFYSQIYNNLKIFLGQFHGHHRLWFIALFP